MLPSYIILPLGGTFAVFALAIFIIFRGYKEVEQKEGAFEQRWAREIKNQRRHLFYLFRFIVRTPSLPLTSEKITAYVSEVRWYLNYSHWIRRLFWLWGLSIVMLIQVKHGLVVAEIDRKLESEIGIYMEHGPPYTKSSVIEISGYLEHQLTLLSTYKRLKEEALVQEWVLDEKPPYSEADLIHIEEQIELNERMKVQVALLEAELGIELKAPYLSESSYSSLSLTLSKVPIPTGMVDLPNVKANHVVSVEYPFEIMIFEVAQVLYESVLHENPSSVQCAACPVERVSWLDAIRFSNALNESLTLPPCYEIQGNGSNRTVIWVDGFECSGWRLPTEAEWMLAARGGLEGDISFSLLKSQIATDLSMIGSKEPNAFGTFDQIGNVAEWVWDTNNVANSRLTNAIGGDTNVTRGERIKIGSKNNIEVIFRGGSARNNIENLDFSARRPELWYNFGDELGFRLVRTMEAQGE